MKVMINKNRNRDGYSFANINLLGRCNANCFFCLGKDIAKELSPYNHLSTHFSEWKNFDAFMNQCAEKGISKIYVTGQTADGLQYRHLGELVDTLQYRGFLVGVRTNGYLALAKMPIIKRMTGGIGYSIHTLHADTSGIIMGKRAIPDWDTIIPSSGPNVRVSIVLNRYNVGEMSELLMMASRYENVRYIQVRRISTDTRYQEHALDLEVYEDFYASFRKSHDKVGEFHGAEQYLCCGKEVVFWRTVETSINSLNYFTDGTCSDEYFIVEGYMNNKGNADELSPRRHS